MTQKLWHWTAPALGDWSEFFPNCHVKLDVTADHVRVVFFVTAGDQTEENAIQPAESVDPFLDSYANVPRFQLENRKQWFSGEYLGAEYADLIITPVGIAHLDRDVNTLGSAEMDGIGMFVFPVDKKFQALAPYNAFSQTFQMKREPRTMRLMGDTEWPVIMTLPYPGAPFTEANFVVRNRAGNAFISNLTGWKVTADRPENDGILGTLPGIKLSAAEVTTSPNGSVNLEATVIDSNGATVPGGSFTIYLEETGGFVPLRRIKTANGKASFRVSAMGMLAGETFKVKAGFRNYSGCAEVLVKVA